MILESLFPYICLLYNRINLTNKNLIKLYEFNK